MRDIIALFSVEQLIILGGATLAVLIQFCYYIFVYLRPVIYKQKEFKSTDEPISVVICARNEHDNLSKFLPKILEQDYPDFEVIVVNDCSEDDTEMLLGEMESKYKHLKHTTIEPDRKFLHGKKLALTVGMKGAKNNQLVFTDADCYPTSKKWLSSLNKSYIINKQVVLGYGGYESRKGLLNKIIRFDTTIIAMQYFGFALAGRPYMGVGRNLSYLKSIFFNGRGFSKHYHLISGDDDLFINENAHKENTAVLLAPESFTRSIPQVNFSSWVKQKKRHLTTGKHYKFGDKFFLSLEPLSRFLFYTAIILLFVVKVSPIIIGSVFAFRFLMQITVIKLIMNKFDEKGFWLLTPVFDIILPIFHLFFIISNKLNKRKSKWK